MAGVMLRRLGTSANIVLLSTCVVFFLVSLAGDPLGELRDRQPPVPEAVIAAEAARLGLDQPVPLRYLHWLRGVVHGDFGPSTLINQDIAAELAPRVWVTLRLILVATATAFLLAIILGTLAALTRNHLADHLISSSAFVLIALPSFWLAVLLKQLAIAVNHAAGTRLLFTVGDRSIPAPQALLPLLWNMAAHLVLPTIVLTLIHYASWSRHRAKP